MSQQMLKEQWQLASDKTDRLSQREKVLLLVTGLILIPGIIDFFLLQPLRDTTTGWQKQTQTINKQMQSYSTQQTDLLAEIKSDPAMELEQKIEGASKVLQATKEAMIGYTDTLIAPQKMAGMLENMLHERGSLKLVSLENLPVSLLFNKQSKKEQNRKDFEVKADGFGLYRHGIRLVFKGNYMTTMDYLKNLEQMPWKFYWQHFDYEVQQYPMALVTLNIYTLSTSRWWIGDEDES
ncbi:MAG: hypothetical protein DRQ47_00140 [Gammaproteobacteria bacterium]|nr:MAG: hypothetical protein DRQ47_00140 [Gammaproteobacteria bacterium]